MTPLNEGWGGAGLRGETTYLGRGCSADERFSGSDDPYLADPSGKIALFDLGACYAVTKINRAIAAGAVAVILIQDPGAVTGSEFRPRWTAGVDFLEIPVILMGYGDGMARAAAPGKVVIQYKGFTLLKDAVDAVPSLLSKAEKDGLKQLVSQAFNLTKKKSVDLEGASLLIDTFYHQLVTYYYEEGKIPDFFVYVSLRNSALTLRDQLNIAL